MNGFERTMKKQEVLFALISTVLLLAIFGILAVGEGMQEQASFEARQEAEGLE